MSGHTHPQDRPGDSLFAVIDIGSNSVRLVVFDGLRRHPQTLFNEKVLCGLGRTVGRTGVMDGAAVDSAVTTLARFRLLTKHMKVHKTVAVATAAVREAANGPDFVDRVKRETGLDVDIISGREEAKLSALGVISGIPEADGVVGDLGGGSLELVDVRQGEIADRVTLPIGAVRLAGTHGEDRDAIADEVKAALKSVDWLHEREGADFYIVGGAWRAIARIAMIHEDTPLPILQGFKLAGEDAKAIAKLVSRQHPDSLAAMKGVPSRRADLLPIAGLILHQVLNRMKPGAMVTSALGLREGLVYHHLDKKLRREDPFIAACRELAAMQGRFAEHGDLLMKWIAPVFDGDDETAEDRRLRHAACLLSDISWAGHPDFRAETAANAVLYGRFVGIGHRGRAFVALALSQVYGASSGNEPADRCTSLLGEADARAARIVGSALRLAQRVSGGTAKLLKRGRLVRRDGSVALEVDEGYDALVNEVVERRLQSLADLLGERGEITLVRAA